MLELLESEVWGLVSQMRRYAIFRIQMTRNGSKKQALKKSSEIFRKSAFAEDVQSVFHPLISKSAVIRRCKLDRIPKLAEQTRDSAKKPIEQQTVPNFPGWEEFHRMVFDIYPMYPLASAACRISRRNLATHPRDARHWREPLRHLTAYLVAPYGEVCEAWI